MLIVVVTVHRVWLLVSVLVILATLEMIAVQVLTSLKHVHSALLSITDINECLSFNGGCEDQCTNTVGSYTCSCPTGFSLISHTACQGAVFAILMV